jgi:hypothetical protein
LGAAGGTAPEAASRRRNANETLRRSSGPGPSGGVRRVVRCAIPHAIGWGLPAMLIALAVAACAPTPQTPQARAAAETDAACRQRADEAYDRQNRGEIYSITDRNVPFSANYLPDVPNRGLSQLYAHDVMVRDCVRNTGTETGRTATGGGGGDEAQAGAPRAQP